MKTLKFTHRLVEDIIEGRKTSTWRMFDDKNLCVGDEIEFLEKETLKKFAEAKITSVREKKLRDIDEKDYEGHKKYKNDEEMLESYRKYYGDSVTLDAPVKIVEFIVLKRDI